MKNMKTIKPKDELFREVLGFIGRFSTDGRRTRWEVIECFTSGCCYWFAKILFLRFKTEGALIMVDYVANHFGCKIGDRVYDITGDVTCKYGWEAWIHCRDQALMERITEDCIMF